jgi:hypothetical protein
MTSARPTFERLENRTHLAADPAMLNTVLENSWRVDDAGFGGNRSTSARITVSPMMQTRIQGDFGRGTSLFSTTNTPDVDMFRIQLAKGQYLNTRLDVADARLTLYNSRAKVAAKMWQPDSLYRVRESGTYYLRLADMSGGATQRPYTLDVRPIGITNGHIDPKLLQSDAGGMYAVRDGNALHITGPTGHGFSLIGDWQQRTTGRGEATKTTYTLADSVTLRSMVGDITVRIPSRASIRIATAPQTWGRYFGEIESINLAMDLGVMDIATPLGRSWGMVFNNDFAGANANGGGWGIRLGSDPLLEDTDLPLNPAVPYLFYTDNKGFTGSFGEIEVGAVGSFGYSVVVDPADSFFVGAKGVPVVGDVAYGISAHGLIPFEPNARPSGFDEEMFGNVYAKAGLDISAFNPAVPVNIDGDYVLDLDANDDGKNLGGLKVNVSKLLADGFSEAALGTSVGRVFGDIAIGVNGKVNLGYEKAGFELSVPVGEGTLVYSGKKQGIFARGRTVDPFRGTPLAIFKPRTSLDIDARAYRNGDFRLLASGTYNPFVYTMKGSVVLDNAGVRASGTMTALGTSVRVNGNILTDGRFTLSGRANVALGPLRGNANFSLMNNNRAVSFGAAFSATAAISVLGVEVGGRVNAQFAFGANRAGLTYAGSGSAALFTGPISVGAIVGISNRNLALGLDLGLLGKPTVNIPLPA